MRTSTFYKESLSILIILLCLSSLNPISLKATSLTTTNVLVEVQVPSDAPFEGHTLISGIEPVFEVNQTGYVTWYFSKKEL